MQRPAVWWVIFGLLVVIAGCSNGSGGSLACRDGGALCGRGGSGAGGAANGGSNGTAGSAPSLPPLHKLDLLFVIDNSVSMSDKQSLLGSAVPGLLERLTNPDCVPTSGTGASIPSSGPEFPCPTDYMKEFEPVQDIHVGIVSSSLGGHGGQICSPSFSSYDPAQNDNAHLIGSVRTGLTSYDSLGFLAWDPRGVDTPPGQTDRQAFVDDFRAMVTATGETGCGYEATLESFYRFLVDPEPPASVTVTNGVSVVTGTDTTVLSQRAAFLRPDSVVAVVLLSDENDCSIMDSGAGWLVATNTTGTGSFTMPRATTVCATDPNSACCRSCGSAESAPPTGCTELAQDPACQNTSLRTDDSLNLRCFDQKRRFGIDFLYPLDRYVDGLRSTTVVDREGVTVPNPLYTDLANGGAAVRQPGHVFVVGIIGVPWQDVATDASVTGSEVQFVSATDLARMDRWKVILGDPSRGVLPTDPLMIESVAPRTGQNPILHAALAPSSSTNPSENPINGHEYVPAAGNDLEYACIFPLPTPRDCSTIQTCDCASDLLADNRPLCNPPTGGVASTTQYFAKAYPGIRHLAFMKDVGQNAIVASICPKDVASSTSSPTFGYNPAMDALLARLRPLLTSG